MSKTQAYLKETIELEPKPIPVPKLPVIISKPIEILTRISDFYLLYPFATSLEASQFLGYKPRFVISIKNSDAFQHFHMPRAKARQDEVAHPHLGIKEKLSGVIETAIEKLEDQLEMADPDINPMATETLIDVIETGMKRLGYGEKAATNVQVTNNFGTVDKLLLARARERMHEAFGKPSAQAQLNAAREAAELPQVEEILDLEILPPDAQARQAAVPEEKAND